ncbi:ABC transporter permease [Leifsonia sp. RAF41]|uniref:ABC transporter permease n=1 Tax=Leifsonia sp. RAF41 TaxID=3233056 RepID=UPI003F98C115
MLLFISKRVGIGLGLIFVVLTLIFLAIHAVPGDPAAVLASGGSSGTASPEAVEHMREVLGLNQPLSTQYLDYLRGFVTGNLGTSFRDGQPVLATILGRLPNTLELVLIACVLGSLVGVGFGALAGRFGGWIDSFVSGYSSLAISIPIYVLGTVFILIFALNLGWLPAGGYVSWQEDPIGHLRMLILPSIALSIGLSGVAARMARASVIETNRMDWVRTAKSWGLDSARVFRRHVLRNSLTPVITAIGLEVGIMLGATVLAERIFNYPGLSALLIDAVLNRDYPVVQGIVILISVLFISINIVVDLVYRVLDPRVK